MSAMNAMNQALGRMRSWFGGAQEKAIDVLPVRLGGPQYHRPTQTPASRPMTTQIRAWSRPSTQIGRASGRGRGLLEWLRQAEAASL